AVYHLENHRQRPTTMRPESCSKEEGDRGVYQYTNARKELSAWRQVNHGIASGDRSDTG
ncbi:Gap junction alpha-5 protein, partial [Clarias magur]